jgi:uroporphyrinogen III methyltransferase/synthase
MAGLKDKRGFIDKDRLDLSERQAVEHWMKRWGVTRDQLTAAHRKAGRMVKDIAAELGKMGAIVDEAIAYRTMPESDDRTRARDRLAAEGADLAVFTSSSTVRNFFAQKIAYPEELKFASIGPVTTKSLAEQGVKPAVEAARHDVEGLVEAIRGYFATGGSGR